MDDSLYYYYVIWRERGYTNIMKNCRRKKKLSFLRGSEKDSNSISSSSDKSHLRPHRS